MKNRHMLMLIAVFVVGYFIGARWPAMEQKIGL